MDIATFFKTAGVAGYSVEQLYTIIYDFISGMFKDPGIAPIMDMIYTAVNPVILYLPAAFIVLYTFMMIFGKKCFSFIRFLIFLYAGFILGTHLLSPIILPVIPQLPAWVVGLVVGIVAAVLSKFLYYAVYALIFAYPLYVVTAQYILPYFITVEGGLLWISAAVAVVIAVLMFFVKKYVEMLGTSMLAGWGIAECVRIWWDFTAIEPFAARPWLPLLIVSGVVGIIGFIIQYKTRERY